MAAIDDFHNNASAPRNHQRSKSSVLRSFIHKRNNSDGSVLPSSLTQHAEPTVELSYNIAFGKEDAPDMRFTRRDNRALGELQQNHQDQNARSPTRKPRDDRRQNSNEHASKSPSKTAFGNLSMKNASAKESSSRPPRTKDNSPTKAKKTMSSTNLVGLLSRPKSGKHLQKLAAEEEAGTGKDKENRTPRTSDSIPPPPIYAQFASQAPQPSGLGGIEDPFAFPAGYVKKERPQSFQGPHVGKQGLSRGSILTGNPHAARSATSTMDRPKPQRPKLFSAFSSGSASKSATPTPDASESQIDPKEIDTHLEAMLDRRNIPENQRYKMRNLNNTIKMEFIRQDWAENQSKKLDRPRTNDSDTSTDGAAAESEGEEKGGKAKRTRGKSFTLSRNAIKLPTSPIKKSKGEGTLGRHFRSKSTESVSAPPSNDRPPSAESKSTGGGFFSKVKLHQGPADYVSYLRKVQKPELVEVGKLHKLRLLLRNETVAWTEDFIRQGGMKEIVDLLHRIMKVEWREEHEDALLHENLLCLKALCTTALALQYLHSIQATLFPALLGMLFDPEKKGPSEFTTRNIITSVLFTYIEQANPQDRVGRAQTVLSYLRDPEPKEEERPLGFVLEMRRERPYRVWCKEVVGVTKEVFWIFLHNLNVVSLRKPSPDSQSGRDGGSQASSSSSSSSSYMARHFPQERPPVPAAPYVGGVEWDATNYLASHLELLNAIVACMPAAAERNALREQLRVSGWERCLGGSLRLCKEKFYGAVHDALRCWVAAAAEDGWEVRDVRYGPPAETRSPPKKRAGNAKKKDEPAPRLEMPKLDFAVPSSAGEQGRSDGKADLWL